MATAEELIADALKGWSFLYKRGFIEGFGHLSVRMPEGNRFAVTRFALGVRAHPEDMLLMDLDGNQLDGAGKLPGEYPIHLEILRARPDVNCVVHYHGMHSTAFTTSEHKLQPIHLMVSLFHEGIPIHNDPRLVHNRERGAALAKALGKCRVALMKAHGVAMTGANVMEAVGGAFLFEENAHRAWIAAAMGKPIWLDPETIAACAAEFYPYRRVWAMVEADAESR